MSERMFLKIPGVSPYDLAQLIHALNEPECKPKNLVGKEESKGVWKPVENPRTIEMLSCVFNRATETYTVQLCLAVRAAQLGKDLSRGNFGWFREHQDILFSRSALLNILNNRVLGILPEEETLL